MVKAFFKYLLSACILFLCGSGFAYTNQNSGQYSSVKTPEISVHGSPEAVQINNSAVTEFVSPGSRKESYELDALVVCNDNDDDDEVASSKKHSGGSNFFVFIFAGLTSGYFFSQDKNMPLSSNHLSYTSSARYIVFREFRI